MARIFVGETTRVDQEVLEAVKRLPDDYWVFAEFNVGRNVDWFVVRQVSPEQATTGISVMILLETKQISRPLHGLSSDAHWQTTDDEGVMVDIAPSNDDDINYYWQAVNTANALTQWLWNNQQIYREEGEVRDERDFRVWPDLLLLGPPDIRHRLPIRPSTGYGAWWYNSERWLNHVQEWVPRAGIAFTEQEMSNLSNVLGLKHIETPIDSAEYSSADLELKVFQTWLRSLVTRIEVLESQVEALANRIDTNSDDAATNAARQSTADTSPLVEMAQVSPATNRRLSEEERSSLLRAVQHARKLGKSRATPTIVLYMEMFLGYNLKKREYNGFKKAGNMFDQAQVEGIIKFGPYTGPNPTVYLPDEDIPTS